MLTIRLQRAGKRNKPQYKLVLAQKTAANQKQFVEMLGFYNPHTKELGVKSEERLNYWIKDQHVQLSATAQNLLVSKGMVQLPKIKAFTIPKKEVVPEQAAEEIKPQESESEAASTDAGTAETSTEETQSPEITPEPSPEPVVEATPDNAAETRAEETTA